MTRNALIAIFLGLSLAACGDDDGDKSNGRPPSIPSEELWSVGAPQARPILGNVIDIPAEGESKVNKVNYVTRKCELEGKTQIVLTFSLDGPIETATEPKGPGLVTLYLQREGDNWSGAGKYETYRWYATPATVQTNGAGRYTVAAPLLARWTAIQTSASIDPEGVPNPAFAAALDNCDRMGFVLGGGTGYGHGVYGPAKLTIEEFRVE